MVARLQTALSDRYRFEGEIGAGGMAARWQVSATGGGEPVWANSGRELYYQQKVLFSITPYLDLGFMQSYSISPDDRRFLMVREGAPSQQSELILTENWLQELKARAVSR